MNRSIIKALVALISSFLPVAGMQKSISEHVTLFTKYKPEMLVPKDAGCIVNNFNIQKLSYNLLSEAQQCFSKKNLVAFDAPQVGDSACQLRALRLCLAVLEGFQFSTLSEELEEKRKSLGQLDSDLQKLSGKVELTQKIGLLKKQQKAQSLPQDEINKLKQKIDTAQNILNKNPIKLEKDLQKKTLAQAFQEMGLDLRLMPTEQFITLCYFLKKYPTDSSLILEQCSRERGISTSLAKDLIRNAKGILQQESINYIQALTCTSAFTLISGSPSLVDEIKEKIGKVSDFNGRKSVACFMGLLTLLEIIKQREIPLVIKVNTLCENGKHVTTFCYDVANKQDSPVSAEKFSKLTAAIVIEGYQTNQLFSEQKREFEQAFRQFKDKKLGACTSLKCENLTLLDELKSKNIVNVLLANAAAHPQFPDGKEAEAIKLFENDDTSELKQIFEEFKTVASLEGMQRANMKTFFIEHIYADTLENALQQQTLNANIKNEQG